MKKIKYTDRQRAVQRYFGELCAPCGMSVFPTAKKKKMVGITVFTSTCRMCMTSEVACIPIRDFLYAMGDPSIAWD